MTDVEAAYIAGFFDGEGTCGSHLQQKRNCTYVNSYATSVAIVNTNRGILEWIQKTSGLGLIYNKPRAKAQHRPAYSLDMPEHHVVKFLKMVQPYVKLKARQVELVLELKLMEKGRDKHGLDARFARLTVWTDEQQARRAAINLELSELNKRGA